jgi:small conductance mechanosensitive channel
MNNDMQIIGFEIINWFQEKGLIILFIFFVVWILSKFINKIIARIVRKIVPGGSFVSEMEEKKRENTLINIMQNFLGIFIWIVAFLVALHVAGVPIAPLLTGAGILGIAVGFGSQSLVRDIINGLFIIIENQFRIGDVISISPDYYGTVEGMTLRVTKLRQLNGTIHYIPNGEIKIASNKSKDYSMVDLKIKVGYNTKIDHLQEIIDAVGQEIMNDPEFSHHIIEQPRFLRIDDLSDYAITARILGKVYPKEQYLISGEIRKRLKKAFEENEIDIPYPTRVIYNAEKKNEKKY